MSGLFSPKNNLFLFLFTGKRKYWIAAISILVFIAYQIDKHHRQDDDLIGESVYFLLKDGHVRSELMHGYGGIGLEEEQTIYHKLFVYAGAGTAAIAGWSMESLHAVSLIFVVLFLLLFWYYTHRFHRDEDHKRLFWFAIPFSLLSYNFLYYGGTFRPEIMMLTLGFFSYMKLEGWFNDKRSVDLILSALLAGLCFATHPHGAIYIAAGFVVLLLRRSWINAFVFGCLSALSFGLTYFADIVIHGSWQKFLYQATHDPIIGLQKSHWFTPFIRLLQEQARLLYNEREFIVAMLLIASFIFCFKKLRTKSVLLPYSLVLLITLGSFAYSKSPQYLLLYFPWILLIIGYSWQEVEVRIGKLNYQKFVFRLLLFGWLCIHAGFAINGIAQHMRYVAGPGEAMENAMIASHIPGPHDSLCVLSYENFVFNEIKHFKRISGLGLYTFFAEMQGKPKQTIDIILKEAALSRVDYIILNKNYLDYFEIDPADPKLSDSLIIYKEKDLLILGLHSHP